MKNSANNSENVVVATESTTKQKAQNAAVTAVKIIVYPAHLVCQTAADLLCIGQAQAINKIDGTPVFKSMMDQQTWTQERQAYVVGKGMEIKDKWDRQREANRQQDAARLRAKLDKVEGVEHITNTEPAIVSTEPIAVNTVPSPPVEAPFIPINQRKKAEQVPTMSPQAAFAEPALQ